MNCNCDKPKKSYHFSVTEVEDGKINDVFSFNFGGHHDLAALAARAQKEQNMEQKHAAELVLGLRLMHHALKKYPDNAKFAAFLGQLNDFKHQLKGDKPC